MSKIKDFIDRMRDAGIDVLAPENSDIEYTEKVYLETLKDMNKLFSEKHKDEAKSDKKE